MRRSSEESPFEAAIARLVARYRAAAEMRASAALAESVLADGMRLGDEVRRRARAAGGAPTAADVAALEEMVARLDTAIASTRAQPEMLALRSAIAGDARERSAALAAGLYADVELVAPPDHVFSPVAVRRHRRDLGETLPEPEALAEEIRALLSRGITAPAEATGSPEPIVLAPSWEAAAAEVALRLPGSDVGAKVLRHAPSGDLWCFAPQLRGGFAVCIAREAEDEWWAASPIPYPAYARRLEESLAAAGVPCERSARHA
jgi:hypothetical protein